MYIEYCLRSQRESILEYVDGIDFERIENIVGNINSYKRNFQTLVHIKYPDNITHTYFLEDFKYIKIKD